jgi:serpin B
LEYDCAEAFQQDVIKYYGGACYDADFGGDTKSAIDDINKWVDHETKSKIKKLVSSDCINKETKMVLTNAIYFKGKWKYAFPEAATRNDKFTLATGKAIGDVPLMSQQGAFRYLDAGTFQALELPYDANQQSMIVFLPKRADGLAELEKSLTTARVTDWLAGMTDHEVYVTLPRFKATAEFQLKDALSDLGMALAFSPREADFSGIATAKPLWLSAVIHKAHVDVSEKGTEAAAATGVVIQTVSAYGPREKIEVFRADHPFFFVIRDNGTGSLLFAGRLVNPQTK